MISQFNNHYISGVAETESQKKLCHRVRYNVYVEQQGFEPPNKELEERDGLDAQAHHKLICFKNGTPIATSRLIFEQMPIFKYQAISNQLPPISHCAEISRFCVDQLKVRSIIQNIKKTSPTLARSIKFSSKMLASALMRLNMETCLKMGKTHLVGLTETSLVNKMCYLGFSIDVVGPQINHHGWRLPFVMNVEQSYSNIKQKNEDFWRFITNQPN